MRLNTWMTAALAGSLLALPALPATAPAQVRISVAFGARLGPPIDVFAYSADRYGAWRTHYARWTPVVVYDVNGRYYRYNVAGARAVVVYRYHNDYFFPPDDHAWIGVDKRYDYHRRPMPDDVVHASPYAAHVAVDSRLGAEIELWDYSADRAGDWRTSYRRWTPVTIYEYHGHYYQHAIAGTRPVEVYRYGYEYFLPPGDAAWVGFDKRFDYKHRPTDDDRTRVHGRAPGPPPAPPEKHGRGRGPRGGGGGG
jgi:roadblock/LC7 domain-containing protein